MFNAGCEGDLQLVKHHVETGVDVNCAHPEFLSTLLVAAILARQEQVALYLLGHGAIPSLPSDFGGVTPAQAARSRGLQSVEDRLREQRVQRRQAQVRSGTVGGWAGCLAEATPEPDRRSRMQ